MPAQPGGGDLRGRWSSWPYSSVWSAAPGSGARASTTRPHLAFGQRIFAGNATRSRKSTASRWRPRRKLSSRVASLDSASGASRRLQEAARLRWSPRLRDLSVSALALADLRPGRGMGLAGTTGSSFLVFDAPMSSYARSDFKGNISVRWVDGDQETCFSVRTPPTSPGCASARTAATCRRFITGRQGTVPGLGPGDSELVLKDVRVSRVAFDFTPDSRSIVVSRSDVDCLYRPGQRGLKKDLGKGRGPRGSPSTPPANGWRSPVLHAVVEVRDLDTGKVWPGWITRPRAAWAGRLASAKHRPARGPRRGVHLWNVPREELLAHIQDGAGPTTNVTFRHSGNFFATRGTVIQRSASMTPGPAGRWCKSPAPFRTSLSLQFSPDDRLLACSLADRRIRLWRSSCRPPIAPSATSGGPARAITSPRRHPAGRVLAVAARADRRRSGRGRPLGLTNRPPVRIPQDRQGSLGSLPSSGRRTHLRRRSRRVPLADPLRRQVSGRLAHRPAPPLAERSNRVFAVSLDGDDWRCKRGPRHRNRPAGSRSGLPAVPERDTFGTVTGKKSDGPGFPCEMGRCR